MNPITFVLLLLPAFAVSQNSRGISFENEQSFAIWVKAFPDSDQIPLSLQDSQAVAGGGSVLFPIPDAGWHGTFWTCDTSACDVVRGAYLGFQFSEYAGSVPTSYNLDPWTWSPNFWTQVTPALNGVADGTSLSNGYADAYQQGSTDSTHNFIVSWVNK